MIFREATPADINQVQIIRNSVKENVLSDPNLVTDKDCEVLCLKDGRVGSAKLIILSLGSLLRI
jgi:hypothetical protein